MPTPTENETQAEFVSRCIPLVIEDETAADADQAAAVCHQMWRDREKGETMEIEHREYKTLEFKLIGIDPTGRSFEGYAAAFNNVDQGADIIHPGAFTKTLAERGNKVKLLWQHDRTEPIGKPLELREDPTGLYIKAMISDTARGRDALALLRDGAIDGLSIGYEPIPGGTDFSRDGDKTIRNLREIKLYEASLVTFPMNEAAGVTALKSPAVKVFNLADYIESQIHSNFTEMADTMFGYGNLTRDERIALSGLIGNALDVFHNGMQQEPLLALYTRRPGEEAKSAKAGRRMRRDKAELVGKIREMLTDLAAWIDYADGEPPEEETPEGEKDDTAPANAGRVEEGTPEKAGPVAPQAQPPTWERERLALLFDIESLQN